MKTETYEFPSDMSNNTTVRKARESDSDLLVQFNIAMALETEQKSLSRDKVEAGVASLFRKPEYGFYLVAENQGRIVGSLMITHEWSDWRNGVFWWIQSVYVLPEFRRQGVYRCLDQNVNELALENPDVCGCRLYVEKENVTAQQTYEKLGMSETHYKMFEKVFRD